jgi:hypothetical protein
MTCKAFLSPLGFRFNILKLPTFVEYVQSVDFPAVRTGETQGLSNPFQKIVVPGEHMTFFNLYATFKLDEDLENYREIFDWIQGIGKPSNFDQYRLLAANPVESGLGPQVDATLTLLDLNLSPNIEFYFHDLYPTALSGFKLDYTLQDPPAVTADVEFSFTQYTYKKL